MLVSIPVIQENKRYVNCLCPFFPFHNEDSDVHLCYICCSNTYFIGWSQRATSQTFWSLYNFSSLFLVPNFMFKLLGGRKLQASLQTVFHITLRANYLNVSAKYSSPILTFVPIYTCAMVQLLPKMREQELFWFGKKCEPESFKLLVCLYNSILTCSSHINSTFGHIFCPLYLSPHFAFFRL